MLQPRVLGIIPARAGSKRVSGKNLKVLCGKPLLAYTIEAAQKAKSLTRVCVSTEDYAIAQFAVELGAYVIKRPPELSEDAATSESVIQHALDWLGHDEYDITICIHPTSPIRDPKHIDQCVDILCNSNANSVVSVECRKRTYTHNASIYAVKVPWFVKTGKLYCDESIPFLMDRAHSIDIDEEIDFIIAEACLSYQNSTGQTSSERHSLQQTT